LPACIKYSFITAILPIGQPSHDYSSSSRIGYPPELFPCGSIERERLAGGGHSIEPIVDNNWIALDLSAVTSVIFPCLLKVRYIVEIDLRQG